MLPCLGLREHCRRRGGKTRRASRSASLLWNCVKATHIAAPTTWLPKRELSKDNKKREMPKWVGKDHEASDHKEPQATKRWWEWKEKGEMMQLYYNIKNKKIGTSRCLLMRLPWQLITSQFKKGIYVAMVSVSRTVPLQNRASAMLAPYTAQRNAPLTGFWVLLIAVIFLSHCSPGGNFRHVHNRICYEI